MKRVKRRRGVAKEARGQREHRRAVLLLILSVGLMLACTIAYYWWALKSGRK